MMSITESSATRSTASPPETPTLRRTISSSRVRTRALTARQERRLVEYVEDTFLDVMRNYKKRDHPSTTLPTLHSYLRATHTLLSLILQIPPVAHQQAALRTAFLLRFTSETLSAITHYPRPISSSSQSQENGEKSSRETLRELLDWLDELDRGWHAVLWSQAWDPDSREGVDVVVEQHHTDSTSHELIDDANTLVDKTYSPDSLRSTNSVSQTDRTRLRSLLLSGSNALEEWLEGIEQPSVTSLNTPKANGSTPGTNGEQATGAEMAEADLESTLEHLGLEQAFDDLFSRTLTAMGELCGEVLSTDEELPMECEA